MLILYARAKGGKGQRPRVKKERSQGQSKRLVRRTAEGRMDAALSKLTKNLGH